MHVAAYIRWLGKEFEKPTVKQHLAAIRTLFDWLVTGQVVATNPAHAVLTGAQGSIDKECLIRLLAHCYSASGQ
jgi:site-specific recombinase XerD